MDWERQDVDWSDKDFGFFRYGGGESLVIRKLVSDEAPVTTNLETASQWDYWLNKEKCLSPDHAEPGLLLILCSRVKRLRFAGPDPVWHLPFEKFVLRKLVDKLGLHPTIVRTAQRQVPYFSAQCLAVPHPLGPMLTYTSRTSSIIPRDLAISATHFPRHGFNVGVVYGCDNKQRDQFLHRIRRGTTSLQHPMFVPGIFAEAERVRLSGAIDEILNEFSLQSSRADSGDLLDLTTELKPKLMSFLQMSYQSQDLSNVMKSTRQQVIKMVSEADKGTTAATGWKSKGADIQVKSPSAEAAAQIKLTGERIRVRLKEILNEYDEKINECGMVVTNMSLTMQTMWNHFAREENRVNTQISRVNTNLARVTTQMTEEMKRDSSQMRSIALLTMVFLPVTAVASIFSTTVFAWDPDAQKTVFSGYLWVFVVLAAILTVTTVSTWYWWTHGLPWKKEDAGAYGDKADEGTSGRRDVGIFNDV